MGKTFKYLFIAIIVGASLFISKPAYSFMGYWYDYNTGWIEQDIMRRTFENHNRVFNNSSSNDDYEEPAPPKKAKITFKSNGDTRGLDYYVNRYPENQRKEARTYFKSIQDSFPQVAKSVGIPTNDLSTGMAALVAGAYMAMSVLMMTI